MKTPCLVTGIDFFDTVSGGKGGAGRRTETVIVDYTAVTSVFFRTTHYKL